MDSDEAAASFTALGQGTRLELMRGLLAAGPSGLPAGEIAVRLGVPASTLSFHLKALETAGLVAATRQGRSLIYAPQLARLRTLLAFLAEACCGGEPHRCGDLARLLNAITRENKDMEHPAFNVLFLCTHNSARSIMAEAILDRIGRPRFEGWSAGSHPHADGPLPEVLTLLKALGHDVSELRSKSWNELTGPGAPKMDFVITLCDTVQGQVCPDFGATTITAAWPLPDPSKFTGGTAERATLLNEVYAGLRRRLEAFISLPVASLDRMALKARVDELADPHAMVR
ncbi:helix-turn-helix domain-containing protein [Roseococcus sp. SDR]|uniref:helix-turn-helix domain-containing protein n=1 Tax=Roseococcus sp. SDR TaxID=2835532 RepID=UPI001BD08E1F|nr:helix-turn-helix domain-containing protein [Roseococcus sp. SDR]MBS7792268.1 helix-turn-helix domain-containing protein [Roseococcus sp. SDR]MBV1847582.1 helix-turn-helix domain-containing protein [Roseococcus sp. SDR]